MNITHLQILCAVIETGTFTRAGEKLNITQSGISHGVSALEQELGVSLLVRDRSGIYLTESGEKVLKHAKEILNHIDGIKEETKLLSNLESGKIRIGSFPSASSSFLPKLLASFQRKYPKIEIVLFEGTDQEIIEWINNRIVDVGFTTLPQDNLDTFPIGKDRFFIILSDKHPLKNKQELSIQSVIKEPFILSKGGCEPLITKVFKDRKVSPIIKYEVKDMATILAMVKEEIGWTLVPEKVLPNEIIEYHAIPLDPPFWRQLGLAVISLSKCSNAVRTFIKESQVLYP
ncbi:LysR family transcriptional regulator [Gracilibacillus kekensis]|uniref:Transcriptional regulator, LysR family n=1 Tax=Gracilibacillus kekensis TaxID=1027249 RepID=A0A1M7PMD1_9BACI|nr:LysR family transcriptional regulator [Gracilibacillus kekensis]SHN18337.1 transcriptional regulator, LysR family [Gracilibacillus kekensis]